LALGNLPKKASFLQLHVFQESILQCGVVE